MTLNRQLDLQSLFGVQNVPGLGYVQAGVSGGALGDEAAVMMISGVGAADDQRQVAVNPATGAVQRIAGAGLGLVAALTQPVTFIGVTLPLWLWLAILISGVGVAGWYFFMRKK